MSIEITLQDADLGNIVLAANRALEVAHREYMRLRSAFARITSETIGAEQQRIFEAIEAGEALPEGDAALQIAAFYEQAVGTVIKLVKEIQGARGTGAIVANLYLLLAQQTGFLMALDAESRGEPYPDQLASYRRGGKPGRATDATKHIRKLVQDNRNTPAEQLWRKYGGRDPITDMKHGTFINQVSKARAFLGLQKKSRSSATS